MNMITGQALRIERGRLGLTQQELADALGVGRRTIVTWESGAQAIPLTHVARIRDVLKLTDEQARTNGLDAYSNIELLSEVIRRLAARSAQGNQSTSDDVSTQRVTRTIAKAIVESDGAVGGPGVAFSDEIVGSLAPRVQHDEGTARRRDNRSHRAN